MAPTHTDEQIAAFSSLADPTRRRLYLYAISCPDGTGRDGAAEAMGITRALAAFHLDRLIADGLLVAEFRRLSGRSGPGAGRPAKIYRRSGIELSVSLPARNHALLARLMARALTAPDTPPQAALQRAAADYGVTVGSGARYAAGPEPDGLRQAAIRVLEELGFEPRCDAQGCVELANCPFTPTASEFSDLVCHANLALLHGVVDGLGVVDLVPVMDPRDGRCCVVFSPEAGAGGRRATSWAPPPTAAG